MRVMAGCCVGIIHLASFEDVSFWIRFSVKIPGPSSCCLPGLSYSVEKALRASPAKLQEHEATVLERVQGLGFRRFSMFMYDRSWMFGGSGSATAWDGYRVCFQVCRPAYVIRKVESKPIPRSALVDSARPSETRLLLYTLRGLSRLDVFASDQW